MLDAGYLAKVAVPHFVLRLEYLQYFVPSVFECAISLHRFVPVSRVADRFPFEIARRETVRRQIFSC